MIDLSQMVPEYTSIHRAYSKIRAKRSGLPYMRHIIEGAKILQLMTSDEHVMRAWLIHPLFQMDDLLCPIYNDGVYDVVSDDPRVLLLAMEYRNVANAFLPKDTYSHDVYPKRSPLADVNWMLVADKVQNNYDFTNYVRQHISSEESSKLRRYFDKWFIELGCNVNDVSRMERVINPYVGSQIP